LGIARLLKAGYVDCYRAVDAGAPGYTYSSATPWLRLDYLFASPALASRLVQCHVVCEGSTKQASDHLPVWAEFR
jgi:exonuclease III